MTTPSSPPGIIGPADATRIPRYAGPATFARLPRIDEVSRADVAIMGVPFTLGTRFMNVSDGELFVDLLSTVAADCTVDETDEQYPFIIFSTSPTPGTTTLGFVTGTPDSTSSTPITTIQYPAGQEAQAKAVAAVLPGAAVAESTTVTGVTVVLGSDGQAPAAPGTADPAAPAVPDPSATPAGTSYAAGACIN